MKRLAITAAILCAVVGAAIVFSGCTSDRETMREIAREEIRKERAQFLKSFTPEPYGFGGALEKQFSHAQGVRVGNFIFVAGQQPYDTDLDENGMPKRDLQTGKNFEEQFRVTLENIKKVLEHYGASMDDVVFLQHFVDREAGDNRVEDFKGVASALIREYFPNALQAMTFAQVENLGGEEQLIESNAIAVVHR